MRKTVAKVKINETDMINLLQGTVSCNTLKQGFTAHKANGSEIVGQAEIGELEKVWCDTTSTNVINIKNGTNNSGTLTFNPTALNWNYKAVESGLTFQWMEVKSLRARFSCDYVITGLVSGGSVAIAVASYNTSTPGADTTRQRYDGFSPNIGDGQTGDMSGHYESGPKIITLPWKDANSTGNYDDSYYIGWQIYAYTGAGSHVEVSNIKFEIEMPSVEDAIITRHLSGEYSNSEITTLKYGAFRNCTGLTSVNFTSASVIRSYAFAGCRRLQTASFLNSEVSQIEANTFAGCSSLSSVSFPNATSIGSYAFWSCTSLSQATFSKVSIVNISAFNDCSGLVSISLPEATWLSNQAFIRCYNLETVYAPKTKNIDTECFQQCSKLHGPNFMQASRIGLRTFKQASVGGLSCDPLTIGDNAFQEATYYGISIFHNTYIVSGGWAFSGAITTSRSTTVSKIAFPVLEQFQGGGALAYNDNLYGFDAGNLTSVRQSTFLSSPNVSEIVLRKPNTITTLENVNAFNSSPFASGGTGGTIYVPSKFLSTYSTATNWATVTGYGTINWQPIESSPYSNKYINGDDIDIYAYVNPDGSLKSTYTWDYEWDYTDGLLSENGWTLEKSNSSAPKETLISDGVELKAGGQGLNIWMNKTDFTPTIGLMEVKMYITNLDGNYNNRIRLSNGTNGIQVYQNNAIWRFLTSTSIGGGVSLGTAAVINTPYVVRILLMENGFGYVWINGDYTGTIIQSAIRECTKTSVGSWGSNVGVYQYIKLKSFSQ